MAAPIEAYSLQLGKLSIPLKNLTHFSAKDREICFHYQTPKGDFSHYNTRCVYELLSLQNAQTLVRTLNQRSLKSHLFTVCSVNPKVSENVASAEIGFEFKSSEEADYFTEYVGPLCSKFSFTRPNETSLVLTCKSKGTSKYQIARINKLFSDIVCCFHNSGVAESLIRLNDPKFSFLPLAVEHWALEHSRVFHIKEEDGSIKEVAPLLPDLLPSLSATQEEIGKWLENPELQGGVVLERNKENLRKALTAENTNEQLRELYSLASNVMLKEAEIILKQSIQSTQMRLENLKKDSAPEQAAVENQLNCLIEIARDQFGIS